MRATLPEIVANKRKEIEEKKRSGVVLSDDGIVGGDGSFYRAVQGSGLRLITEIKPSSPSAGVLRTNVDVDEILAAYNAYAAAISVLTDQQYFGGSIELLTHVSANSPRPTLCKDFILDRCQVYEARRAGAQAVLLIVKILDDQQLRELHGTIVDLAMTPVVEVQTADEVARALAVAPEVLLVNNRDLSTFDIDLATSERLLPLIPPAVIPISASGIQTRADIDRLLPLCRRFLVGSTLMQSADLVGKLRELSGR